MGMLMLFVIEANMARHLAVVERDLTEMDSPVRQTSRNHLTEAVVYLPAETLQAMEVKLIAELVMPSRLLNPRNLKFLTKNHRCRIKKSRSQISTPRFRIKKHKSLINHHRSRIKMNKGLRNLKFPTRYPRSRINTPKFLIKFLKFLIRLHRFPIKFLKFPIKFLK